MIPLTDTIEQFLRDNLFVTFFLAVEAILLVNWIIKKIFGRKSNTPQVSPFDTRQPSFSKRPAEPTFTKNEDGYIECKI